MLDRLRMLAPFDRRAKRKVRVEAFGDISAALTVTYTVSGTATSGTDFTALSGSVTFAAKSDHTDVTVTLSGDSSAEDTETVTVTIDEDEDYQLGNDLDSLFLRDDDTRRIVWAGRVDGNWRNPLNWETFVIPTSSDEVYFNGSVSNVSCTNFGEGQWVNGVPVVNPLTSVSGLHIVNAYSGVVTLGVALAANTYEQLSGTLNQPSGDHLTITKAMIWTGGTLNGITDSVSNVNIDGAVGRIDPPDTGSMSTGSALRVIGGSAVKILAGTMEFAAGTGDGMYVGADSKVKMLLNNDVALNAYDKGTKTLTLSEGSECEFVGSGSGEWGLRVINNGGLFKVGFGGVDVRLQGGDAKTPSYTNSNNANAKLHLVTGSKLRVTQGMRVEGGSVYIINQGSDPYAMVIGNITITGGDILFSEPPLFRGDRRYGVFWTSGTVTWSGGTFRPSVDSSGDPPVINCDIWLVRATLTVNTTGNSPPQIIPHAAYPVGEGAAYNRPWTIFDTADNNSSIVLEGKNYPALPAGWQHQPTIENNVIKQWAVKRSS